MRKQLHNAQVVLIWYNMKQPLFCMPLPLQTTYQWSPTLLLLMLCVQGEQIFACIWNEYCHIVLIYRMH